MVMARRPLSSIGPTRGRRRKLYRLVVLLVIIALASFNFVDPTRRLSSFYFYGSVVETNDNYPAGVADAPRSKRPPTLYTNHTYDRAKSLHSTSDNVTNRIQPRDHFTATPNTGSESNDGEEEDKDLDPFATQHPQGDKWTSPHRRKLENDPKLWWRGSDSCFEVDDICRSSKNRWLYYQTPSSHNNNTNTNKGAKQVPFQPTFELQYMPYSYRKAAWADVRVRLRARSSSRVSWEGAANNDCRVSSAPHHVVLQSSFNDMMGEFYVRTLLNMYTLMTAGHRDRRNSHMTNISLHNVTEEETQFYVHIPFEKNMLDAHKLLLSGMLPPRVAEKSINHTSSRWAKSAVDLVRPERKKCQCYRKLVFCGYSTYAQQNDAAHKNAMEDASPPTSQNEKETNYTLWPWKHIDAFGHSVAEVSSCKSAGPDFRLHPYHCDAFARLRSYMLANIEARHPNLAAAVVRHRKEALSRRRLIDGDYGGDTKEWTFVGLAQRTSRRSWVNLPNVTAACDAAFLEDSLNRKRVICVEVNVEETKSPHEQLLLHRSLDALIGIHGAQMTQAALLPPNSHVLELLPWIPHYARGDWVQTTSIPTPLGMIFHNTDLNHFGHSLDRDSVPLCENSTREEERDCFTSEKNGWKFQWDNRHFFVDDGVVFRFINDFVLPMKRPRKCKDLLDRRHGQMTLYNVWCEVGGVGNGASTTTNSSLVVRHYYRDAASNTHPNNEPEPNFPRCHIPKSNPTWNYYNALIDANAKTAEHASRVTENPSNQVKDEEQSPGRIPRRLIFTHKDNLFDCSKSTEKPELFHLAENAKATLNAYQRIWPDLEFVFLSDGDCIDALNRTEPELIPWFNSGLEGMYKADLCRAAYLFLHGGYYFDVDILVVRPYVAPKEARFVTVKGQKFPEEGFFQAFLAAERGDAIVRRSLKIMLDALYQERPRGKYLGPTALMEAWMEVENVTNAWNAKNGMNGVYLLAEADLKDSKSISKHLKLANYIASKDGMNLYQHVPIGHGENCQFSSGACNVIVISESDDTLYFYSRVLGTKWCGKRVMDDGECTDQGVLLERIRQAGGNV